MAAAAASAAASGPHFRAAFALKVGKMGRKSAKKKHDHDRGQ